jgi:CheY-like chemotaxis protein
LTETAAFDAGIISHGVSDFEATDLTQQMPLVLLAPIGFRPSDHERCAFEAIVSKASRPSQLAGDISEILSGAVNPVTRVTSELDHALAQRAPLRILIAEDNVVNQKVLRKILERLGYYPAVAATGSEAVNAALKEHYDLILMDVQMPEMDGLEATRQIRKACSPRPRIVAMTANAFREDRERCLHAGMDGYISKPLRTAELQAVLEHCAHREPGEETGQQQANADPQWDRHAPSECS